MMNSKVRGSDKISSEEFIEVAYFLLDCLPVFLQWTFRVQFSAQAKGPLPRISHLEGTLYYT